MRRARLEQAGLTPADAAAQARRALGNPLALRETAVDMWRYGSMERLGQDIRYALRMLLRAAGFTLVAVLSLALGIGANTAIFSLIDRVMLRALPIADPDQLVVMRGLLIDESVLRERMIAKLSVLFGILAVVLTSVGLYGVLAYSVTRRTSEIGIRLAIGAFPRDIVWMVIRETLALAAVGIAAGVPLAMLLSRQIESLLYGLTPGDATTIAAVVLLVVATACLAAIAPSRRAARVDPLRALRYE